MPLNYAEVTTDEDAKSLQQKAQAAMFLVSAGASLEDATKAVGLPTIAATNPPLPIGMPTPAPSEGAQ